MQSRPTQLQERRIGATSEDLNTIIMAPGRRPQTRRKRGSCHSAKVYGSRIRIYAAASSGLSSSSDPAVLSGYLFA